MAAQARAFVQEQLQKHTLAVSPQLVSELHHVLTERGLRLPKAVALQHISDLLSTASILFRSPDANTLLEATRLSTITCVHIWDFLIVLPFQGELDCIYTTDPHFHSCKELQIAPVENPFGIWVPEGKSEP